MISLNVNGAPREVDADPATPLLWVLRDELGLTGTKYGCGVAACGACTVHLDGEPVRACSVPVSAASNAEVVTIEGLAASAGLPENALHPVQTAWISVQVPQCVTAIRDDLAAAALLKKTPKPTDARYRCGHGNLCRCGTYPRVRRAIRSLSDSA